MSPPSSFTSIITLLVLGAIGIANTNAAQECRSSANASNVKIDVYYETLCPDSIAFLTQHLIPTYRALGCIIDLRVYPFGKATIEKFNDKYSYQCQHGQKECQGNLIQACTLQQSSGNFSQSLPFIDCMEKDINANWQPNIDAIASKCAKLTRFNYQTLNACANSETGYKMMQEIGDKTRAFTPKITFIPTVAINGKLSNKARHYFTREVCLAYNTTNGPDVCSQY